MVGPPLNTEKCSLFFFLLNCIHYFPPSACAVFVLCMLRVGADGLTKYQRYRENKKKKVISEGQKGEHTCSSCKTQQCMHDASVLLISEDREDN
jgi:hypothetical protein